MNKKHIKFTNIEWDDEQEEETEDSLPSEWETTVDADFNPEESGADLLSDKFGFCVTGFNYEIQ